MKLGNLFYFLGNQNEVNNFNSPEKRVAVHLSIPVLPPATYPPNKTGRNALRRKGGERERFGERERALHAIL